MQNAHAGRRYVVTGGTSGIGSYCAAHLTAAGARVWVTGTRQETVDEAVASGGATAGAVCDVGDPEQVAAVFDAAAAEMGGIDGVFANAGIDGEGLPAQELDLARTARVMQVNALGVLATAQAAHRLLERPGVLVVNASVNALRAEKGFADYNASKAAALSIAASLALEWGEEQLSVVTVCPGYIPSRMTSPYLTDPAVAEHLLADIPSRRFGEPREIAELVGFLMSNTVGYLNGSVIPLAGGRNL